MCISLISAKQVLRTSIRQVWAPKKWLSGHKHITKDEGAHVHIHHRQSYTFKKIINLSRDYCG